MYDSTPIDLCRDEILSAIFRGCIHLSTCRFSVDRQHEPGIERFRSPLLALIFDASLSLSRETDAKDLRAATRQIDQSINRLNQRITTASLASHERVDAVSKGVFPIDEMKRHFGDLTDDRSDRSISSAIDATFYSGVFLALGPRSDRGHRTSATAAEISNLFAASKQGSECPRESAQRVQAWLNVLYRYARIKCVCVRQMCAHVSIR